MGPKKTPVSMGEIRLPNHMLGNWQIDSHTSIHQKAHDKYIQEQVGHGIMNAAINIYRSFI